MNYPPYDKMYEIVTDAFKHTDAKNPIDHELVKSAFKKKPKNTHKGSSGSLLVCAGSPGLTGAGCLSTEAALRCGCGLVTLCCAKELNTIYEIKLTEAMTLPVESREGIIKKEAFDKIFEKLNLCDALLYGPGLSRDENIKELLSKLLKNTKKPVVIDADGLYALAQDASMLKSVSVPVIITPHIGEFVRLTGYDKEYILNNLKNVAKDFAKKHNVIVVLKSHKTVVSDGENVFENVLGSPAMAVGGTGDVLSGMIASFLAQGHSPLLSALAGVYLHSLAADMATLEMGEMSLLPRDIIRYICYASKITSEKNK
ncbi:MAG: NAD(P)H-hydrate dehydratase [Clostridia bacterium]|nr:NAD(P)H-hydrate dehydratase [Clostridia bacterium]